MRPPITQKRMDTDTTHIFQAKPDLCLDCAAVGIIVTR
jgi:hypothetical protein